MARELEPKDKTLASADLFGDDDDDDDFWLNGDFETPARAPAEIRDPPKQRVEEVLRDAKDNAAATSDVDEEEDDDYFPAGQQFDFDDSAWSPVLTPAATWNSSPAPTDREDDCREEKQSGEEKQQQQQQQHKKSKSRCKGEPAKPPGAKKRKHDGGSDANPLPPFASCLSWNELLRQHAALLGSKGKVNGRKFNKTALDLLNWCAENIKKRPDLLQNAGPLGDGPFASTSAANGAGAAAAIAQAPPNWEGEREALSEFRSLLLNAKEIQSEEMVVRIVAFIQNGLPPLLTADEKRDLLLKRSLAFVQELSPQLSLKTGPVIRSYVNQIFDSHLDNLFAEIRMPEKSPKDKALQYRRMFCNFIDDQSCVSFACTNKALLGKLSARDVWFLTFFAFVTTRRVRGDNLLQLGCTGLFLSPCCWLLT